MSIEARVLLGVSGGIAAYKSALLVRLLKAAGFDVRCALTRSAEAFVAPLTLEVLTGHAVYRQEYLTPNDSGEELHMVAAAWADVLCVYPATAHLLGRLAQGLADDFLTTTALAFRGPLLLAPAMHSAMWAHPAVQQNAQWLKDRGAHLLGPAEGALANGETGLGRLVEPEVVREAIAALFAAKGLLSTAGGADRAAESTMGNIAAGSLAERRILVTAGPTFEDLDPVRFLGNRSSGKMGFAIAGAAAAQGAEVVLVAGPVERATPPGVRRIDVRTALEMQAALAAEAPAADAVIMAAAVADYRPAERADQKIKKSDGMPELRLVENPDILLGLAQSAPEALRIGFAAETGDPEEEACAKLERKKAHWIVANDVSRGDIGFSGDDNEITIYRRDAQPVFLSRRPKREIADRLVELIASELAARQGESEE